MINIVLYQPQIPPNTGNVARLCVGTLNHLHLVGPMGFSIDDKQLKRAGLDYWKDLTLSTYENFEQFMTQQKPLRIFFYSKKVSRPYTQVQYQDGDYLVFGAETFGLPDDILHQYQDQCYTIPMDGPIRSLNLSTSVGIVVYEALRQIKKF